MTSDAEVHDKCSDQVVSLKLKPPVFCSLASLVLIYRPTEGRKDYFNTTEYVICGRGGKRNVQLGVSNGLPFHSVRVERFFSYASNFNPGFRLVGEAMFFSRPSIVGGVRTRHPFRWGKRSIHQIPFVVNNNRADVKTTVAILRDRRPPIIIYRRATSTY
ncbi:hypothetical protein TNCV_3153561 [Trichonephila clavipes]|nr:hypothetical protein TNCV_3153561 [Trichonephila clavipes]